MTVSLFSPPQKKSHLNSCIAASALLPASACECRSSCRCMRQAAR